jgi:alkanesulfonate monooxygenase SsuD/methylene tetrahydromethanopterin reductase-like flavin-dependent oxidoreductase (luciferase family)
MRWRRFDHVWTPAGRQPHNVADASDAVGCPPRVAGPFPLRVGVLILPEHPWRESRVVWQRAEELGFAHAWTYDHLTWRGHRDLAWYSAIPTLTAAALATERIQLGPLVASPNFRHPLTLAKEIVALDDISGGRVTLGIGQGSAGWDATMMAAEPLPERERSERFGEFVELTDLLLRQPEASYVGTFYSVRDARTYPGCVQQPRVPLAIAASGLRGMRLAVRFAETWVTTGDRTRTEPVDAAQGARDVRDQAGLLEQACAETGRDPATLSRLVVTGPTLLSGLSSINEFADTAARYAAVGVTDLVVPWPRANAPYQADLSTFERIFGA